MQACWGTARGAGWIDTLSLRPAHRGLHHRRHLAGGAGLRGIEGPLGAIYLDRAATVTNEQIRQVKVRFRYNRVKVLAEQPA